MLSSTTSSDLVVLPATFVVDSSRNSGVFMVLSLCFCNDTTEWMVGCEVLVCYVILGKARVKIDSLINKMNIFVLR